MLPVDFLLSLNSTEGCAPVWDMQALLAQRICASCGVPSQRAAASISDPISNAGMDEQTNKGNEHKNRHTQDSKAKRV